MAAFWTESYRLHFQKYFKKPFDVQVYHGDEGLSLKLGVHDLAVRNFRVYASMGLADKLVENAEEDFGEVVLFSDVRDEEIPRIFVNALFFILYHDISLGARFAIGLAQTAPAFAGRYGRNALYFTLASDEHEGFNKVRNGEQFGRVYQAYFIAPDEDRYLEEYGPDAFENQLFAQPGEALKIRRPSFLERGQPQPDVDRAKKGTFREVPKNPL